MLGDFGVEKPQVEESFGFFGAAIRVNPDISDLAVVEAFRSVGSTADDAIDAPRVLARALVHPDDVDLFVSTAAANRQAIEDLVNVGVKIIEALTARPTVLPSDSSDGQSTTVTSSTDVSSSPALRLLEGRPDLQVAVKRVEEARLAG